MGYASGALKSPRNRTGIRRGQERRWHGLRNQSSVVQCINVLEIEERGSARKGNKVAYSWQLEAESGTEDDAKERKPATREADVVRKLEPWLLHTWNPDSLDRSCHDSIGNEAESDDPKGKSALISKGVARGERIDGQRGRATRPRSYRGAASVGKRTYPTKNHAHNVCTILYRQLVSQR